MASMGPVQVIAVTSGKGGVGKSVAAVNLALALAGLGRRVMLLDGDLAMGNVDVLLGLGAERTLVDVFAGDCGLEDIVLAGPGGIRVVPAASGMCSMARLSARQQAGLIHDFGRLADQLDVLVVDTASGIDDSTVGFVRAAREVLVVLCDEPASIADAYALIRLLNRDCGVTRFRILANMVAGPREGRELFAKLLRLTEQFLAATLQYVGAVPWDDSLRRAVQRQTAVCEAFPRSKSALAFRAIAEKVDGWPLPANPRGHVEFFVEHLIRTAQAKSA
ncbi:MinD/ParA family protein [Azotobacter chroococcum]|jgi:flagellar biosynthesis protein FlhG|uniref:Flagellar biosynthesis protein FlhG n=1 Tax=Azotobacter chroococcum TaxID=353 RepID=A0A4R1PQL3_9GAMM|nr:MinD/ParA family protein [Azotobacter chroococcum]TBV91874.1 MinD/ParA family protein [Azotobacter chroococcum]TCL32782.1 flagellar biosynthesis protein FlhG [Azotobacter chroococcum]